MIKHTTTTTVAEATITDDYLVELRVEPGTVLTPGEAQAFAAELSAAAIEAAEKYEHDKPRMVHGFDVAKKEVLARSSRLLHFGMPDDDDVRGWDDNRGMGPEQEG